MYWHFTLVKESYSTRWCLWDEPKSSSFSSSGDLEPTQCCFQMAASCLIQSQTIKHQTPLQPLLVGSVRWSHLVHSGVEHRRPRGRVLHRVLFTLYTHNMEGTREFANNTTVIQRISKQRWTPCPGGKIDQLPACYSPHNETIAQTVDLWPIYSWLNWMTWFQGSMSAREEVISLVSVCSGAAVTQTPT